jgi:HD-like signal output (HDOD) protein
MSVATASHILEKLEFTHDLPTVPAVLMRLLRYMEKPLDQVDVAQIVNLISQDKSLAGHCLQVANSPLFGSSHENEVVSIQASVMAVGVIRIQQIAVSCSLLRLMPTISFGLNPAVFWAHSLGCALVSREFATRIGYPDPAKAYVAGLLHDIGIVALLWVAPHDFRRCFEEASRHRIPLHEAEQRVLGTTHCESGKIIAQNWHLSQELTDVIVGHHSPAIAPSSSVLTSIISVSDLLCRISGLGYGYNEDKQTDFTEEPAFAILAAKYPALRPFDLARFTFETEALLEEVRAVVSQVYGAH